MEVRRARCSFLALSCSYVGGRVVRRDGGKGPDMAMSEFVGDQR